MGQRSACGLRAGFCRKKNSRGVCRPRSYRGFHRSYGAPYLKINLLRLSIYITCDLEACQAPCLTSPATSPNLLILLRFVIRGRAHFGTLLENGIDQAIFDRPLATHEIVPVKVLLDLVHLLTRMPGHNFVETLLAETLARLLNVPFAPCRRRSRISAEASG